MISDKWDIRFLELAKLVSSWSKDPSTKVGAVIVDENRRIVSCGYNGFPRGVDDGVERYEDRDTKYRLIVHADENAILNAKGDVSGCTMYIWPIPPCSHCAKSIIQSGIAAVRFPMMDIPDRWMEDIRFSIAALNEAGVRTEFISMEDA